ncbi:MAG: hypothetical protein JXA67_11855 [Micromonosporaceae bacterium]|nr:hypothetical protein [Micromonosporaceae bacterium]
MSVLKRLVWWVAGWTARVLDVEGRTDQDRRMTVLRDASLPADDSDDLGLRHLTRTVMWFVVAVAVNPVLLVLLIPASSLPGGREDVPFLVFFFVVTFMGFFLFFMMCVHLLKWLVVEYLLEDRWNPRSRVLRAVMLAQTPEVALAMLLAGPVAWSLQ